MANKIHWVFLMALVLSGVIYAAPAHAFRWTDAQECSKHGGVWGKHDSVFECNLPTEDAGKECKSDADCESACVTDNDVPKETHTPGRCYGWTVLRDVCLNYVSQGVVIGIYCG